MAAGDFTKSELKELQVSVADIWKRERSNRELTADTNTVSKIIELQTADVSSIEGTSSRDESVDVSWVDTQTITGTEDTAGDCTPTGVELQSQKQNYQITVHKQLATPIKVAVLEAFRDNVFDKDNVIAKGFSKGIKELDNQLNNTILAKLDAFAGANFMPAGKLVGFDPGVIDTYIDPAQWNKALFAKFTIMNQWNKYENPILCHNLNFLEESIDWPVDSRNSDEKDKIIKLTMFPHFWDSVGMATAGIADNVTYMIDTNAVAFASKNYFPNDDVTRTKADTVLFSMPSTIEGVRYDVTQTTTCEVGTAGEEYFWTYQMRVHFDLFNSPEIVPSSGDTGIIKIFNAVRQI